jgi:DME family drug/metabolite transporter
MRAARGYLMIMGAATFWGVSATAAKFLLNRHVETVLIVQTRVTISALLLVLFYIVARPQLLHVRWQDLWRFALLGIVGVSGANFTYYFTIKESTVATAIILQYTAPLAVMAYTTLTGEEKFTSLKLLAAILSLVGCFLAVGAYDPAVLKLPLIGLLSGVGSMVCFAFLGVYTRHLLRRSNIWTMTVYSFIFASLFWLVINPPAAIVSQSPSGATWGGLAVLAVISVLIPHSLFFAGMQHVVASRAIITSTLEPIVAMTSAAIVLGEFLHPVQVIGAVLVVCAIVLLQMKREDGSFVRPPENANAA